MSGNPMDMVAKAIDRLAATAAREHEQANRYVEYVGALSTAMAAFVEHMDPFIKNGDSTLRQEWQKELAKLTTTSLMIRECEVIARMVERDGRR